MSKTKYCRVCGDPLNRGNKIPETVKFAKNEGRICYDCYKLKKSERRKNQSVFKNLYIRGGLYPISKTAQKLDKSEQDEWRLVRSFSTSPRSRIDPETQKTLWFDSEYDEWAKGRKFVRSLLGGRSAREKLPAKEHTRAGTVISVPRSIGKGMRHEHVNACCIECGHDVVRHDERGYKYCTKCFVIQEPLPYLSAKGEDTNYERPKASDAIVRRWYRTKDPEAFGTY